MVDIAIVGIGCRFPGGISNPDEFWKFPLDHGDGIVDVPADRWSIDKYYDPDPDAPGRMYTRRGGFLTQSLWDFDADFFGIAQREAAILDPQQRLLLEVTWEALDDAGMAGRVSEHSVGVYIGGFSEVNARGARVSIGAHCDIASFVSIHCADSHKLCIGLATEVERQDIVIEDHVFIGSHSFVKGGAHIGHHSVVAAGTIVGPGMIPPYSLIAGNPMLVRPGYYRARLLAECDR